MKAIKKSTFNNDMRKGYPELRSAQEASLSLTTLSEWRGEQQVVDYGAIIICRSGEAVININFKEWKLHRDAVITIFPNDVVTLRVAGAPSRPESGANEGSITTEESHGNEEFLVEMLKYDASLLREASLQLEQTVYSSLRQDRCRQDIPTVTNIINCMFQLLRVYFEQSECTCIAQLVLCQLKAFFIGFHEYMQRAPLPMPDEVKSYRVRELFNIFMRLMERDYKTSRDVNYYAQQMSITPKYLTNIVKQVTGHTPKSIIDQYTVLQIKIALHRSQQSIKEIAWEYRFPDASFFCRYFKKHTGMTPQQARRV